MVAIPQPECPTLAAVKRAVEANQERKRRDYIGASAIGHTCSRHIWYEYNGYQRDLFDANTLFKFEDGHRTEELIIGRLKMVLGVQVWDKKDDGSQYSFRTLDGKFGGSVDGFIKGLLQAPKTPHVLEVKCTAEKGFNEFRKTVFQFGEKRALEKWNATYYAQAQIYMRYFNLDRHYLVVALAGGRDMASCRTEFNPEYAEKLVDKAERILQAQVPPARVSEKPCFYICKWCPFAKVCHG